MKIDFKENNLFLEKDYSLTELTGQAKRLFEQQVNEWSLAADGYKSLQSVLVKKYEFDGFTVKAQFNPGRITSSSAKVDKKTIDQRPCFLCVKNLPLEQKAVKALNNYIILVNPYPIFPVHFTISSINHEPQLIVNEFNNLLLLAEKLGNDYTLFYNGPKCGASAPDHLHFQAGTKGFMTIDNEYDKVIRKFGRLIKNEKDIKIYSVTGYLRNFFSFESNNIENLNVVFNTLYDLLSENEKNDEPMMNILCSYDNGWRVILFPRSKHRPSHFFEEGGKKILISPAAVDLGGVCIFPRKEDFEKITKEMLVDVYQQVTISDAKFKYISEELMND